MAAPEATAPGGGVGDCVLADTSAWVVSRRIPELRGVFDDLVVDGRVAMCDQVALELLYSTRDQAEFQDRRGQLSALPQCPIGAPEWTRALDVFEQLSALGPLHHRQVKIADLLIAAAAEGAGVEVLHYDRDFDLIAGVTGQTVRWIAPAGEAG
jgi:predicted nucleic acid-binding protein